MYVEKDILFQNGILCSKYWIYCLATLMQNNNPVLSISIPYLRYDLRYDFFAVIEIIPGNSLYWQKAFFPTWYNFFITVHKLRWNTTKHTNGCTTSLVKNPKHTTTMVSHLPLWQHGFGKSAYPTPESCFRRVCPRAGLKGLLLFYCVAEKKNNY